MVQFEFINESTVLESAIKGQYQWSLVFLSILIAALSSYVAFAVSEKIHNDELTPKQYLWWATGALVQGTGIWAMHFIAMLAFVLPFAVTYELWLTVLSVIPATLASAVALRTHHDTEMSPVNFAFRSVLMGGGIGLMHFTGMAAMHMEQATMLYDKNLFALSVVIAVLLAAVALGLKLWAERKRTRIGVPELPLLFSAMMMGLAIAAMHYTAMAATYFFPAEISSHISIAIPASGLAWSIGIITIASIVVMIVSVYISQRLELVDLLEKSEARVRAIIGNTAEAIIAIDHEGKIETFNHSAETMFGYSAKEVTGKSVSILLPEEMREQHDNYTRHSEIYESRIINMDRELHGLKKNGVLFPIELNVAPMLVGDKKGFVGVIRDITERKKAEAVILEAKEEAENASKVKSEFLSNMSHELRTPINSILGFGELLKSDSDNPLSEEQKKSLNEMIKSGKHLLALINEVLDLTRIESGQLKLEMEPLSIPQIGTDCVSLMRGMAQQYEVNIDNKLDKKNEYIINADPLRLKQILLNLLSNGIKYNKKGGSVTIDCTLLENNNVRVLVTDTGRGLTNSQRDRLFNNFERISEEYDIAEGVGIGLSICKQLTELMGGTVGLESTIGEGSTFWVDFPVCVKSTGGITQVK
ncbi:MAG: PAS domain S-box protein [Gammaproteobacteria bacterium]|nr:PAS domain S-box protein [Gammaproteobacteria bacterium]